MVNLRWCHSWCVRTGDVVMALLCVGESHVPCGAGKYVTLKENSKIVMTWRFKTWAAGTACEAEAIDGWLP